MNKINGYTVEEAEDLVEYISEGKGEGKTLSYLFEAYGKSHGRAKGSVRNYYYALLKSRSDERVDAILRGKNLEAEEIREFTEEETEQILGDILRERSKGLSIRRAIKNIAGEDEKLMLRLQNKYRNVLKKQPEKIKEAMLRLGLTQTDDGRDALKRKIEAEINSLYDKINEALKQENARLSEENRQLKLRLEENPPLQNKK